MNYFLLLTLMFSITVVNAQVGIGTTTPAANSALDVTSTTKGIMLPRLNDTSSVSSPSEGLLIYNRKTLTPAYHNGTKWNTMDNKNTLAVAPEDSITYTITNPGTSTFVGGVLSTISSLSTGVVSQSTLDFTAVNILKVQDANSIAFFRSVCNGGTISNMVIEFKIFVPGGVTPTYAIKLTSPFVESYQVSAAGSGLGESVSISAVIYGFKNFIYNSSYAWNRSTNTSVPY